MKRSGASVFAAFGLALSAAAHAADAAKVDYAERNTSFAPAAGVGVDKRVPETNGSLQERRVTPEVLQRKPATVGDRRAVIDVTEANAKKFITPDSSRPEARDRELSAFDHRESKFQPDPVREQPKLVTRYQAGLTAASATHQSRLPALGADTTARVNRFVFRRNVATPPGATANAVAAGSAPADVRP